MLIQETPVELESWRSNDPLPDETQKRIHELIADAQREIDSLDREIKPNTKAITDRRQQSIARMATLRAAVSSVRLLPTEIWMNVFSAYMGWLDPVVILPPMLGDGPWKLGHVCHRWRGALLGVSELWKNIEFRSPYPITPRFELNLSESCRDVLSRQDSLITLSYTPRSRATFSLTASFNHRLHILNIRRLDDKYLRLLLELPSGSFPALETLRIQFDGLLPSHFLTSPFQSSPSLRKVEYTGYGYNERLPDLLLPWSQLTTFRMSKIWTVMPYVHRLLPQFSSLVHLKLTINDNSINIPPYQQLILPNLQSLRISMQCPLQWEDLLDPLVLPSLKTFELEFSGYFVYQRDRGWLPALISLITRSQCALETLITGVDDNHLSMGPNIVPLLREIPSIQTLEVMSVFKPEVFDTLTKEDLLPNLRSGTWVIRSDGMRSVLEWLQASPNFILENSAEIHLHCTKQYGFQRLWEEFLRGRLLYQSRGMNIHLHEFNVREIHSVNDISYLEQSDEET